VKSFQNSLADYCPWILRAWKKYKATLWVGCRLRGKHRNPGHSITTAYKWNISGKTLSGI